MKRYTIEERSRLAAARYLYSSKLKASARRKAWAIALGTMLASAMALGGAVWL